MAAGRLRFMAKLSSLEIVFPEFAGTTVLPHDIDALKTLLEAQKTACEQACQTAYQAAVQTLRREAQDYVIRMIEQAVLARHRLFGASSEQLSAQSRLFDEAEALAQSTTDAQAIHEACAWQAICLACGVDPHGRGARGARGRTHLPLRHPHG